jgi:hypothetical protein
MIGIFQEILQVLEKEVENSFGSNQNQKFWFILPFLFKESFQMNLNCTCFFKFILIFFFKFFFLDFQESHDVFDDQAFNSFDSLSERFFRLQFHIYQLLKNDLSHFLIVLTNWLFLKFKEPFISIEKLDDLMIWVQKLKKVLYYWNKKNKIKSHFFSSRKLHNLMDYQKQIRRFGSLGNNYVEIQEKFFVQLHKLYNNSNKKSSGDEVISFYCHQYSYQLWSNFNFQENIPPIISDEEKELHFQNGIKKKINEIGFGFGTVKKLLLFFLIFFFIKDVQRMLEKFFQVDLGYKFEQLKVFNSWKLGEKRIVASKSYYGRSRFDPICLKKRQNIIYGIANCFFSVFFEKKYFSFVIVSIYSTSQEIPKIWNLSVVEKPEFPDYQLFETFEIQNSVAFIGLGNTNTLAVWENTYDPEVWLEKIYKQIENELKIPENLEEILEIPFEEKKRKNQQINQNQTSSQNSTQTPTLSSKNPVAFIKPSKTTKKKKETILVESPSNYTTQNQLFENNQEDEIEPENEQEMEKLCQRVNKRRREMPISLLNLV